MRARLQGLQRIAVVYTALKHAKELALEEAAAALHTVESKIEQQRLQVRRTSVWGRAALSAGAHEEWKIHESQNQLTERNTEALLDLRRRREKLLFEAAEVYRAGTMQLEQMESVLRALRVRLQADVNRKSQRESDDRFLARGWWQEQAAARASDLLDDDAETIVKKISEL